MAVVYINIIQKQDLDFINYKRMNYAIFWVYKIIMAFVVIEGDNGTGKDTLAKKMADKSEYDIISYLPTVKEMEKKARKSADKIHSFLEYNQYCGNLVMKNKKPSIVIRYWISTLAAAYADYIYEYDEVIQLTDEMKKSVVAPNVVIRIWAGTEVRLNRIISRNMNSSGLLDDVSIIRAQRYEWISKEILNRSGYHWKEFNNTSVGVDELVNEVLTYLRREFNE